MNSGKNGRRVSRAAVISMTIEKAGFGGKRAQLALTGARIRKLGVLCFLSLLLAFAGQAKTVSHKQALRALTPPDGTLLFGAYVGGKTGEEDDMTLNDVVAYERLVGRRVDWVYFSNNWYRSRRFPVTTAKWIRKHGATPFVRLMMRSDPEQDHADPLYKTKSIARGDFDPDLTRWMQEAARFGTPILAEYGTEMNGEWFQWNARWNGRRKGAERFAAAYRHIIDLSRKNGATNIIWVFHVNWADGPPKSWNRMEKYYPGDSYIDWLGISLYSMQAPFETEPTAFAEIRNTFARLNHMAAEKPVIIAEFGTDVHNPREPAAPWAKAALKLIYSRQLPNLIGFSWWNETWPNDDNPIHDTDTRLQSDKALTQVFRRYLKR